ncbi:unnamed protein product [Boreogadus saida]
MLYSNQIFFSVSVPQFIELLVFSSGDMGPSPTKNGLIAPELTPVPEPCPVPEPYSFPRGPLFQIFQTFRKGPALYLAFQRGAAF